MMCMSIHFCTHLRGGVPMRTNIVIDDELMNEVKELTGMKTKKEIVELGLKTVIRLKKQERIRKFRGKLKWDGDLEEMHKD